MFRKDWNIKKLKSITILLIACSLVFSTVLFINNEVGLMNQDKLTAARFLSTSSINDVVLSVPENGFLIEYASGRNAFLDGNSYRYNDYNSLLDTKDSIFYSRNLAEVDAFMKKNHITHIFIDKDMLSGSVWNSPDEGLLFLLKNSDSFVKVFENNQAVIYRLVK